MSQLNADSCYIFTDTETTGLDYENDRIIEVACLELFDDVITGNTFHKYYNPGEIIISDQAEQIQNLKEKLNAAFILLGFTAALAALF